MNWVDPEGLLIDILADIGFIALDIYDLLTQPCNIGESLTALGLDVAGAFIPFATGLGKGYKVVKTAKPIAGKITGYSKHGLNQVISRDKGRGVKAKSILDAVRNPKKVVPQSKGSTKYVGKEATVILNKQGKIVTTYGKPRGPQVW